MRTGQDGGALKDRRAVVRGMSAGTGVGDEVVHLVVVGIGIGDKRWK